MTSELGFWQALAQFKFMQQALLAGLIVGGLCSVLSVYVVLRKMAFIGQGISHAAFGGIALGLLLAPAGAYHDLWMSLITTAFCVAVAVAIGVASARGRLSADSAIGIFLASSMALGVLLIALRTAYSADIITYLFGSILAVTPQDVWLMLGLAVVVSGTVAVLFKELLYYTFDPDMARASGLPADFLHYLLLVLLALTIVVSVKVVGIVLLNAFLVIPGATAKLLTRRFSTMMLIAVIIGVLSSFVGLYVSHLRAIPSGATIVLTQFVVFCVAYLFARK